MRRYTVHEVADIWERAFWDALGRGESEEAAEAAADRKVREMKARRA